MYLEMSSISNDASNVFSTSIFQLIISTCASRTINKFRDIIL